MGARMTLAPYLGAGEPGAVVGRSRGLGRAGLAVTATSSRLGFRGALAAPARSSALRRSAGTIQKYAGTVAALLSLPLFRPCRPRPAPLAGAGRDPREREAGAHRRRCCAGLSRDRLHRRLPARELARRRPGFRSGRRWRPGRQTSVDGRYLYGPLTYLGNPISQLPGRARSWPGLSRSSATAPTRTCSRSRC